MFQIVNIVVFLGISVFLFFFGMHIMKSLDTYMEQRKQKRNEYEEARRQGNETAV